MPVSVVTVLPQLAGRRSQENHSERGGCDRPTRRAGDSLPRGKHPHRVLKLLSNQPSAGKQRVYLHFVSDEFEYRSVYDVSGNHIAPVEYADITKRKMFLSLMFLSLMKGVPVALVSLLTGVAAAVAGKVADAYRSPGLSS
jgi:hypothetical protein